MTESFHILFSAWGDPSPEGRAAKTDAASGPGFFSSDPTPAFPVTGRGACMEYAAPFPAALPGAAARAVAVPEHHGRSRAAAVSGKGRQCMARVQCFAGSQDGKAVQLIGFTGMGEPD
ncbi:nuclear transport factor 2 family protein [Leisingera daeponensis]|uniref:nuclear transport factor 2 family protein n=1 Tax=Leisingera daeponensis TaxID=405746 RepID=UPI001C94DB33|nr:nuclear transport factor 2 family protein [Leisingera daeponensis]MBY6056291.1 nuclear transport factor 2 family protein [Leisingera daeponensis]